MTHWQTASGALLCGQQAGPSDSIVDELTPADCPDCLDVMMVARRACEIVFTESCNAWAIREVRDQLYAEFGHIRVERSRSAIGALVDD